MNLRGTKEMDQPCLIYLQYIISLKQRLCLVCVNATDAVPKR